MLFLLCSVFRIYVLCANVRCTFELKTHNLNASQKAATLLFALLCFGMLCVVDWCDCTHETDNEAIEMFNLMAIVIVSADELQPSNKQQSDFCFLAHPV
jgi:hypothetical protein